MIVFVGVMLFLVVAPLGAVAYAVRDHGSMAPATGAIDVGTRIRGDRALTGAVAAWPSVAPLVRIESRRLLRHPAPYLVAAPLCALALATFLSPSVTVLSHAAGEGVTYMIVPYAWGVLIASNLLTLRSRRWHSDELLATTAVPERSRTLAHLLATGVMVPGAVVLLVLWHVVAARSGRAIGSSPLTVLAFGPLLVVGAGCVGVAVARWLPHAAFGWVAVIATVVLQVNFGNLDTRWRWLHFSMFGNESIEYPELSPDHHGIHLAYLVGGIVLVAAIALARQGVDRNVGALLLLAIALIAPTGLIQTRPSTDDEAAAFARRVEDPGATQHCAAQGRFTVCTDPVLTDLVPHWSRTIDGVTRRLPDDVFPTGLTVRQRPLVDVRHELAAEVGSRVDPSVAWPDDGEVSLSGRWALPSSSEPEQPGKVQLALAFRVASAAVGLPADAWWSREAQGAADWMTLPLAGPRNDGERPEPLADPSATPIVQCAAADQARSVAALWLAGQSTPEARSELRRRAGEVLARDGAETPVAFDATGSYRQALPDPLPEQGTVVIGSDVVAAAALLELDDDAVAATLQRHWDEIVSPLGASRTAADVLRWFGSDPARAAAALASYRAAVDPEPHPEDVPAPPHVTGPCPAAR